MTKAIREGTHLVWDPKIESIWFADRKVAKVNTPKYNQIGVSKLLLVTYTFVFKSNFNTQNRVRRIVPVRNKTNLLYS